MQHISVRCIHFRTVYTVQIIEIYLEGRGLFRVVAGPIVASGGLVEEGELKKQRAQ